MPEGRVRRKKMGTAITAMVVLGVAALAVRSIVKGKKNGTSCHCGGDCGKCGGGCR